MGRSSWFLRVQRDESAKQRASHGVISRRFSNAWQQQTLIQAAIPSIRIQHTLVFAGRALARPRENYEAHKSINRCGEDTIS